MLIDDTALLMEIHAHGDPIERPFTPEELRVFEQGMTRGLNAPVDKAYMVPFLMQLDGPLRCIELAGMMAGGRFRIVGEAEEVGA